MDYQTFLNNKRQMERNSGFEPLWMPEFLYDFQVPLVEFAIQRGLALLAEDCGLGKTPQELVWAENMLRHSNRPGLILTPLAVAKQFVREGNKFGLEVHHARDGVLKKGINVTNYQQLHKFNPADAGWLVCDESGCLKHHDAKTRKLVAEFSAKIPYVLLGTATPAPNDFMELGNSAEVLRVMKYTQMLAMFFTHDGKQTSAWRLRGYAKKRFWQWMATWARALRKPSDLGFDDNKFKLPPLNMQQHTVASVPQPGCFWAEEARSLAEQRQERRSTLQARCECVASLVPKDRPFIAWCHLNAEGDLLESLIPDAVQVAGCDSDDAKEEKLEAFSTGQIQRLVTKPIIAGFGLNWQHCSDISVFPSHSWEQWYQLVRRCWRFGQQREVTANVVSSEAESRVLENMIRKERQGEEMYDGIIREMTPYQRSDQITTKQLIPTEVAGWLSATRLSMSDMHSTTAIAAKC
jgi:hypothetical protein